MKNPAGAGWVYDRGMDKKDWLDRAASPGGNYGPGLGLWLLIALLALCVGAFVFSLL
jgi:hypothetical protein